MDKADRLLGLTFLAVILLLVSRCASADDWKKSEWRKEEFAVLFETQIKTLEERLPPGHEEIINTLRAKKESVLSRALQMDIALYRIPFVPVITRNTLGITGHQVLLSMVHGENGERGESDLLQKSIYDTVRAPATAYYIFDVEIGAYTKGLSPQEALVSFEGSGVSPLSLDETLALATHTEVLFKNRWFLWAAGSFYDSRDLIPRIYIEEFASKRPMANWSHIRNAHTRWATPSCAFRE